jgi:hypothetical protein
VLNISPILPISCNMKLFLSLNSYDLFTWAPVVVV